MNFDFSPSDLLPVSREWLLERVSEKEIMDFYLGARHDYGDTFRSPFRHDKVPSCTVFVGKNGRPLFKDFGGSRAIDCFDVAAKATGEQRFSELLRRITRDMGLAGRAPLSLFEIRKEEEYLAEKQKSQKPHIRVRVQPLQREDRVYLESFGLNDSQLLERYRVYSPQYVWYFGSPFYGWNVRDPALAYYFGKAKDGSERWKIYFYKRTRDMGATGRMRFFGNTSRIAGWVQLPERGNVCVFTKSLKDVMCLSLFGIPAVAMQGEMTLPYDYIVAELRGRFQNLYTLYDFDRAGVTAANRIRRLYNIEPFFLTNGRYGTRDFGAKDFSDLIRNRGMEDAKAVLREAVRHTGVKLTLPFESDT